MVIFIFFPFFFFPLKVNAHSPVQTVRLKEKSTSSTSVQADSSSHLNLSFSSYLGDVNSASSLTRVAVDSVGNSFITGSTNTNHPFPLKNSFQSTIKGYGDAFLYAFNQTGNLTFSTLLGGNGLDTAAAIAVDANDNVVITGYTNSTNFPTKNAFNATFGGSGDVFLAKFTSTGQLVFSTYIGGNGYDTGTGITFDSAGNIYLTGYTNSKNFFGLNSTNSTAFLAKFTSSGQLVFNKFFGPVFGNSISLDKAGNIYVISMRTSLYNLPTLKNAFDNGTNETPSFISKFNPSGDLLLSSYFGGNSTGQLFGSAVDQEGNIFITGMIYSSNFIVKNAFNDTPGIVSGFLSKFNSTGQLVFSTFLGGNNKLYPEDLALDSEGNCYITGIQRANYLQTKNAFMTTKAPGQDAFVMKVSSNGSLVYNSFLGGNGTDTSTGIAVDASGSAYVVGFTTSRNFPVKNAFDSSSNYGIPEDFETKFNPFPRPINPSVASNSSDLSTSSQAPFLVNLLSTNTLLVGGFIGFLVVIVSYISVEFRKYSIEKQHIDKTSNVNFVTYLKEGIHFKKKNNKDKLILSDETFAKLEEIEKENRID